MAKSLEEDSFHRVGRHFVKFEPPDIIHVVAHGVVELSDAKSIFDSMHEAFLSTCPYILRDARDADAPSRDAREFLVKDSRMGRVVGVVSVGGPFRVRVALSMLDKAMRILRANSPRFVFFDTYEEARDWIDADRARRASA